MIYAYGLCKLLNHHEKAKYLNICQDMLKFKFFSLSVRVLKTGVAICNTCISISL
jgi:hypothetical protein